MRLLLPVALWAVSNMTIDIETEWKCGLIVCCGCPCLIEWLVWFDEIKGKCGLTLCVMFHSMQRLVHFVAQYVPNMFFLALSLPPSLSFPLFLCVCLRLSDIFLHLCPSLLLSLSVCPSRSSLCVSLPFCLTHSFCFPLSVTFSLSCTHARAHSLQLEWRKQVTHTMSHVLISKWKKEDAMPAWFVTTSSVTKHAGITARFVTLVTKHAIVTKCATTSFVTLVTKHAIVTKCATTSLFSTVQCFSFSTIQITASAPCKNTISPETNNCNSTSTRNGYGKQVWNFTVWCISWFITIKWDSLQKLKDNTETQ